MKKGLEEQHWFPIFKSVNKELYKSWGWSERIFLSKRDWMMDQIRGCYGSDPQRTHNFMDTIFQREFTRLWHKQSGLKGYRQFARHKITDKEMKAYNQYWQEWKCFLLKSNVAYHEHLFGRTAKTRKTKRTKRLRKRGGAAKKEKFLESLKPKNIKDTCIEVCKHEKEQYPKRLDAQAKLLGNKIDKKKKAELMKKLEKQCPKTCARELKKISVIAKDPAFAQLVGKFEKMEKKKPKGTVKSKKKSEK